MKDATLAQGNQVLNLILQKQVPADQLQDLLESGLLSDLLCANLREVKRDEFRRLIGLKPLTPTFVLTIDPAKPFVRDMRKEGWTLLEHTPRRITSASDVDLVSFLKSGENSINREEMARRARNEFNANFGQEDAEWLLEHQDEIPTEFRKFYLAFPGTVWQDSGDDRYVPYLYWYGERWCLYFDWLENDWESFDRLLRLRKSR